MTNTELVAINQALNSVSPPARPITSLNPTQLEFCSAFGDIGSFFRSNTNTEDESVAGLVSGLVLLGEALWKEGLITAEDAEGLTTTAIVDADSEVTSELEIVSGELELWYPAWSDTLNDSLEKPHLLGLVTSLLTYHRWAQAKLGDDFALKYMSQALRNPFQANPLESMDIPEPVAEETPAPVVPEGEASFSEELLNKLILASEVGASFRFDVEGDDLVLRVSCPEDLTIGGIKQLSSILGDVRLIHENNVISLVAPIA